MAPTRGGRDVERGNNIMGPGIVYDAAGNPLGSPDMVGLDMSEPVRPGRKPRRSGLIARGLRGVGNRLLGNG